MTIKILMWTLLVLALIDSKNCVCARVLKHLIFLHSLHVYSWIQVAYSCFSFAPRVPNILISTNIRYHGLNLTILLDQSLNQSLSSVQPCPALLYAVVGPIIPHMYILGCQKRPLLPLNTSKKLIGSIPIFMQHTTEALHIILLII